MNLFRVDRKKIRSGDVLIQPMLNLEFVHSSDIIVVMAGRTKDQIRTDIFKFIKSNGIMTLGTSSPKGPWLCTVYYGVDNDMNLYIVTDPNSIHGKNIAGSKKVAFNIFDSRQKIFKPKKGVQGSGIIEIIKGIPNITKALYLWHRQNPGVEKNITIKEVKKFADTKLYKITPKYLKFFNKVLYSPEEYGIWEA